jgi:hypothetical protein
MTRTVRRRFANSRTPTWIAALWSLALLSLFLLPSDFRAGSEMAHGHSLFQLWLDAADGHVDHHHIGAFATSQSPRADWLDPRVDDSASSPSPGKDHRPDVPEQNDSAPSVGGIPFMLVFTELLLVIAGAVTFSDAPMCRLFGRAPRVLFPPPRWTPVSA